ncbi:hypothetical protein [Nostoc sp.]
MNWDISEEEQSQLSFVWLKLGVKILGIDILLLLPIQLTYLLTLSLTFTVVGGTSKQMNGLVKRLLKMSYLWTGSINGVKLQIWATWRFYAVLIDVADTVANEFEMEVEKISIEMLFRSFYHFNHAYNQELSNDLIAYLTSPKNRDLGVVKYQPKSQQRDTLDLSPHPT